MVFRRPLIQICRVFQPSLSSSLFPGRRCRCDVPRYTDEFFSREMTLALLSPHTTTLPRMHSTGYNVMRISYSFRRTPRATPANHCPGRSSSSVSTLALVCAATCNFWVLRKSDHQPIGHIFMPALPRPFALHILIKNFWLCTLFLKTAIFPFLEHCRLLSEPAPLKHCKPFVP